jgi:hypothetical protein
MIGDTNLQNKKVIHVYDEDYKLHFRKIDDICTHNANHASENITNKKL